MADRFEDLGIAPELAAGAESLGWDTPSGLQRDALPVIRRGNNVMLYASTGSGEVGAYGLGILDQLISAGENAADEAEAGTGWPRALVLVPDDDTASRTADTLARLAGPAGLSARAHGAGWSHRPVDVLVLSPTAATAAVRDSALKLDGMSALVIHGADLIHATGQWDELETMADIVPGGAQRILVTGRLDPRIEGFVERHVRKAMSIPPRPTGEESAEPGETVRYRVVSEQAKPAAVVSLLTQAAGTEVAVVCRSHDRAETLDRALEARGIVVGGDGEEGPRVLVLPRTEADQRSTRADVISADVPMDADAMQDLHVRGGAVLVTPRERAHLMRIAKRAGIGLQAIPDEKPAATSTAEAVRDRIRALLSDADLSADLALIEPLLEDFPAAEVAAAALHLARSPGASSRARAGAGAAASAPAARADSAPVGKRPGAGAPPPSSATTWTHLFFSVGTRDGLTPGDVVGAMTGEAGIDGEQVGKIDIRESHSTVEVATPVADKVITALNGRTVKGRSLRVDYDRKTRAPRKPDGTRSGAPRGGSPRGGPSRGGPSRGGPRGGGGGRGGSRGPSGGGRGGPRGGGPGGGKPPRRD